ncbi:MAG: glycosyltransferase [Pyrinomonadaceae bacterium]
MANIRGKLETRLTPPLHFIKKKLRNNLSISAKLSLRAVLARSKGALSFVTGVPARFAERTAEITEGRSVKLPGRLGSKSYSFETPSLAKNISEDAAARLLSKSRKELMGRGEIESSIVVPVFNQAAFTMQCLYSLLTEIDLRESEVIVVDNASTDDSAQMLSQFSDVIHVISNKENRGFVDACNQGATAARGKFLVFLNNDTEVLPGWLEHLEDTVKDKPSVGAVGSLFLYPDGSIQEAGAIVWKNGEAYHYGWGESPDNRRFNFAREIDYCSAASLLIRRDLFEQLGGFDRRFAPAYYEDVDLCFGVRSLGYQVIYQPMSRLIHYEGVTAGTDATIGMKQFQILNQGKFVEKWRDVLEREHLTKSLKRLAEASDRNRDRMRIIVFDERVPTPDRDAGSLRMFTILKILARLFHVIFVPLNRPGSLDYERELWQEGIETADAVDYRRLLTNQNVVAAIVSRPRVAEALIHRIRRVNPHTRVVFDMVDTHFIRFQREHDVSRDAQALADARHYRRLESRLAQASDLVWSASLEDKLVMEREAPNTRIEVVPTIHELHQGGKPFAERKDLLFIGNFAHRPNQDAVLFFQREVFPYLRQALPNLNLDVIGDNPSPDIVAYNSDTVRVRGYVPDVESYLRERRVFIAPLRFGAGIKGKVGEAMAHGIPVVTTSVGAEGFGLTHEFDVMIADDPKSFAAAIEQLYLQKDLWERVARNSRLRIEKHFTTDIIAQIIHQSLEELLGV